VVVLAASLTGCALLGEEGSGVIVTRRIPLTQGVHRVEIADAFAATVRVGGNPSGTVRIDDNLLDRLRLDVDGDTLRIDIDGQVRGATLRAEIRVVSLERVVASGATQVRVVGPVVDDLTVEASGASKIEVSPIELDELVVDASGASRISIEGAASRLRAEVSGASNLALFGVEVDEAEVEVSGASHAEVTVLDRLEASASGASSVRYRGDADRVISDVSGSSSVVPA
jgi:putative autotransporter adhesin-like protein